MKNLIVCLIVFSCAFGAYSATKRVDNPKYEVKNTGIYTITSIAQTDTSTRIEMHVEFLPKWWVVFNKASLFIKDTNSEKLLPIEAIEGAVFGKRLFMPISGDTTIVLVFPKLDDGVKKIDYITKSESSTGASIYGISLNPDEIAEEHQNEIPSNIKNWLQNEIGKSTRTAPLPSNSPLYLKADSAYLVGYIKGYDRRLNLSTSIIIYENDFTRENYPTIIKIFPDGRFKGAISMTSPLYTKFEMLTSRVPVYLEPGQTVAVILNWNEFLTADRLRNQIYQLQGVNYQGPLAEINKALYNFKPLESDNSAANKLIKTATVEEFSKNRKAYLDACLVHIDEYAKKNAIGAEAGSLLRNDALLDYATYLFDYFRKNPNVDSIGNYGFLKNLPLNDVSIVAVPSFSTFINRLEFCKPLKLTSEQRTISSEPTINFLSYLDEENIALTNNERVLFQFVCTKNKTDAQREEFKEKRTEINALYLKFKPEHEAYEAKYIDPYWDVYRKISFLKQWNLKDSLANQLLDSHYTFAYEMTKTRDLKFSLSQIADSIEGIAYWDALKQKISHPELVEIANDYVAKRYSNLSPESYALPVGTASDIFKKIIEPFKGKYIFVDFWSTSCSPCIAGIKANKEIRAQYKNSPDCAFVFITSDRYSPKEKYEAFVEEQAMEHTFRLNRDDYNYMRELFKFSSIPHYVLIGKDGRVFNGEFHMSHIKNELQRLKISK